MVLRVLCLLLFCFVTTNASAESLLLPFGRLKKFSSDGCSLSPNGTPNNPTAWLHCCVQHDLAYWAGGTEDDRRHADEDLKACIAESGYPNYALAAFEAVRYGGEPKYPTCYRWGYGWNFNRRYEKLNSFEKILVQTNIPKNLTEVLITKICTYNPE